ncbi:phage tail protein [Escherichia coli]|nr:phage tail protein [Escherichia coli]
MATKYYALLTNVGAAKLANATALGEQVEITQMAVGDGNGALPTPNPAQTALVHELRRAPLNTLTIDPVNTNQIIAEQVIPEDVGGWWIREIGLYDSDGDMIAVANCAETYKPLLQEGSGRMQVIRVILIVSSTQAVTLKIDPSVVLATRQYVDDQIIQVKAFVDQQLAAHIAAADPHKQYAPKASPALTGTPTAPTAAQTVNNTQIATTGFVKSAIAALVASSPAALDTLNELAAALGNDPNFATTVTNALAGKQPLDSTLTNLSGKTVNGILQYLGLGEAAKRDVGTGDNQIPDMGAFASGSGWFRLPGGYIVQFGTFSGNTTRFISGHFPIPFPNQPMVSVSVMSDAVQSDPSNPAPQVLSVNFEHISNSAWRVATSDISQQYRFSYVSIGR